MCGILGLIVPSGERAEALHDPFERALARLEHRGPDGREVWVRRNVVLGHTRLAVRDPGAVAGAQPIATPCGRFVLTYNGELYDDADWRRELEPEVLARTGGDGFRSGCDAETLLWILAIRGVGALDRVRGMYAFAFVDTVRGTLLLARDPLGVKPLVYTPTRERGFAFASEVQALCALPHVRVEPDPEMVAAYLATSRRSAFGRTLIRGVRSLAPGDVLRVALEDPGAEPVRVASGERFAAPGDGSARATELRTLIERSVDDHLVSDVPLCSLLSGGLDSAIITARAASKREGLATWCAYGVESGKEHGEDPAAARAMAAFAGTRHTAVPIDEARFAPAWREHVEHLREPLSTPNEIAISEISRVLRASGAVVALSGEGADELFGGYGDVLAALSTHASMKDPPIDAARFHLELTSWVSPAVQETILRPEHTGALDFVIDETAAAHRDACRAAGPGADALEVHLRLQRAVNLTSLLERLDAATMRHGVEGRTPFADVRVRRFAERLAIDSKFVRSGETGEHRTKIALREAFRDALPPAITARPKASFPLPFERWVAPIARETSTSSFVRSFIAQDTLDRVAEAPGAHPRLAWLFGNLDLFGRTVFEERPTMAV